MDSTPACKILFAAGRLTGGGAERQLMLLASALSDLGSEITVATLTDRVEGLPFRQVVLWDGKRNSRLGTAWHLLAAGLRLRGAVREDRPDVVISWLAIPTMLAGHMLPRLGVPLIMAIRNSSPEQNRSVPRRLQHAILRSAYSRCRMVVANSPAGIRDYKAAGLIPGCVTRIVPNCIDSSRFRPPSVSERASARDRFGLPHQSPTVLYVGRASPEKQIPLLIATLARLSETMQSVCFLVVGIQPDWLRRQAAAAGITLPSTRTSIVGQVDHIEAAYWASDALLLTSQVEGSPNVVHEARACGLPVVSTDVGDVRATATQYDRISPPSASALSEAVLEVLHLRVRGAVPSNYLSPAACAQQWLGCIHEVLSSPSVPP